MVCGGVTAARASPMMPGMAAPDPTSLTGKRFPLRDRYAHVVVGAGEAGIAAALDAAGTGGRVLLLDEHPLDPGLIGLDVPWLFGGRMDASVQNPARMEERIIAARPALERAVEAGVEVALGVSAWGGFLRGPSSPALAQPMLGLADRETAWLVGFDRLTVAAGVRDVVLPVPGWQLPGVMGARGFWAAAALYRAFSGTRVAIIGGGAAAEAAAGIAAQAGIAVVARIAEPAAMRIEGMAEVSGLAWRADGAWRDAACDTVVLALDLVPNVELLDQLGCTIAWDGARGGFAPVLGEGGVTSRAEVFVRGDGAGTAPVARLPWMRAALADDDALVCACEEVTAGDLRALRPPRYLGAAGPESGLAAIPAMNADHAKRLTRAGMGPCQGRRCRESVHALLSEEKPAPLASHRAPLRPLPLAVLAALEEDAALRANWTGWFGIAAQWLPHWEPVPDNPEFIGGRLSGSEVVE